MTQPIVFISRNKIKEGRREDFRGHYAASVPVTEAQKPHTLAQLAYEDEGGTEVTIVRLFPDPAALDLQIQGADDRSRKAYEFIEPLSIEIFGEPSPSTVARMQKIAGSGVTVSIFPAYLGGFIR